MQIKATIESILKSKGLSLSQQNIEDTFNKIEDALIYCNPFKNTFLSRAITI